MNNREKFLAAAHDREVMARIFDKAEASRRHGRATFTEFLSERELSELLERRKNIDSVPFAGFGGYENAARQVVRFSEGDENYPISAIRVTGRGIEKLRHGDFLGSLMSLGIDRKNTGDIVKYDGGCIIFCLENIAEYIKDNLTEVGGVYVNTAICEADDIEIKPEFESITGTVASLRADSVVAVMLKTSRSKAAEYIQEQSFFLNQCLCTKCDKEIKENDILSVRRHGKARVEKISGMSKKGRIFITIQKYM